MIAIIPARGGSKGLPGKNIKDFCGKPLIAYSIEAALQSENIDEVILSTDDKYIESIAVKYGANSPFIRPKKLADDDSLAVDNYIYTINRLEKIRKTSYESFIVLQPTSPLRSVADIDGSMKLFLEKNADSVISYTEEDHPLSWHKRLAEDGSFIMNSDEIIANRQAYEPTFYPNGAIYIFKTSLIRNRKYYSDKSYAYIMPRKRSIDIDTTDDFDYAEYLKSQNG